MPIALLRKFMQILGTSVSRSPFLAANPLVQTNGLYIHDPEAFSQRLHDTYIPGTRTLSSCPCCEGTDFTPLDYPENYRPQEGIFLSDECLSQKLSMCSKCGLILSRRIMPPDFYFEYINSSYDNFHIQEQDDVTPVETFYREKHRFVKDLAWEYLPKAKGRPRLLEVSSFVGTGLSDLAKEWDVCGLEAENAAALFSIRHYPAALKGRIINDVLENAIAPDLGVLNQCAPFDAILFMYAFRQIAYPENVVRWLKHAVKPGGIVVIAEGVMSDFIFSESNKAAALHFYANKSCYYNLLNLNALLGRHGFTFLKSDFLAGGPLGRSYDQSAAVFRYDKASTSFDFEASRALSDRIFAHFLTSSQRFTKSA